MDRCVMKQRFQTDVLIFHGPLCREIVLLNFDPFPQSFFCFYHLNQLYRTSPGSVKINTLTPEHCLLHLT